MKRTLLLLPLLTGCAHTMRADSYSPEACQQLRRDERKAGALRTGAGYVAAGLGAGGAIAQAVNGDKAATITLAISAVLAGSVGLGADSYAQSARAEWEEQCTALHAVEAALVER